MSSILAHELWGSQSQAEALAQNLGLTRLERLFDFGAQVLGGFRFRNRLQRFMRARAQSLELRWIVQFLPAVELRQIEHRRCHGGDEHSARDLWCFPSSPRVPRMTIGSGLDAKTISDRFGF